MQTIFNLAPWGSSPALPQGLSPNKAFEKLSTFHRWITEIASAVICLITLGQYDDRYYEKLVGRFYQMDVKEGTTAYKANAAAQPLLQERVSHGKSEVTSSARSHATQAQGMISSGKSETTPVTITPTDKNRLIYLDNGTVLQRLPTYADGSCGIHAIWGTEKRAGAFYSRENVDLRKRWVDSIRQTQPEELDLLRSNLGREEYYDKLEKPSTYLDVQELFHMATFYNKKVAIYYLFGNSTACLKNFEGNPKDAIYIWYTYRSSSSHEISQHFERATFVND